MLEYFLCINLRDDIEKLKTFITNEVVFNQQQVDEYLDQWKPFKSLWEMDKDVFMQQFNELRIAAKSFEKNFMRYAEIENQVLLQEGVAVVQFIEINANQLKTSIFGHIDDWRDRHRDTLRRSGYKLITGKRKRMRKIEFSLTNFQYFEPFRSVRLCREKYEKNSEASI